MGGWLAKKSAWNELWKPLVSVPSMTALRAGPTQKSIHGVCGTRFTTLNLERGARGAVAP